MLVPVKNRIDISKV